MQIEDLRKYQTKNHRSLCQRWKTLNYYHSKYAPNFSWKTVRKSRAKPLWLLLSPSLKASPKTLLKPVLLLESNTQKNTTLLLDMELLVPKLKMKKNTILTQNLWIWHDLWRVIVFYNWSLLITKLENKYFGIQALICLGRV